jgi:hypothetical protein
MGAGCRACRGASRAESQGEVATDRVAIEGKGRARCGPGRRPDPRDSFRVVPGCSCLGIPASLSSGKQLSEWADGPQFARPHIGSCEHKPAGALDLRAESPRPLLAVGTQTFTANCYLPRDGSVAPYLSPGAVGLRRVPQASPLGIPQRRNRG